MRGVSTLGSAMVVPLLAALSATSASAQCTTIDFDSFTTGTLISTQYDGVTFSAMPQSCGGMPNVNCLIVTPTTGGTSSPSKCLGITTGCPDFSPDYIVMTFDRLQRYVTFNVGVQTGSSGLQIQVRAYSGVSGGTPILTQSFVTGVGVHRQVSVGSENSGANIRRIEVESTIQDFESIDDLSFNFDPTPPTALITSPRSESLAGFSEGICACNVINITGIACDEDGEYVSDRLEYRPITGGDWTLYDSFEFPVCDEGQLYGFETDELDGGFYELRLTVENGCGMIGTDTTTIYVDKSFTDLDLRSPGMSAVVGGVVCLDGTAWDRCFDQYELAYRPFDCCNYLPVDPATPQYTASVINDPLGIWNTISLGLPDGNYDLRLLGTDLCGNSMLENVQVTLDNTPPISQIMMPMSCSQVGGTVEIFGTASDANLMGWTLQYTGGDSAGWTTIATGNTNVLNDVLGVWDTSMLRACSYTLRLRVVDRANVNCSGDPHISDSFASVEIACPGDDNGDGMIDILDLNRVLGNFQLDCNAP